MDDDDGGLPARRVRGGGGWTASGLRWLPKSPRVGVGGDSGGLTRSPLNRLVAHRRPHLAIPFGHRHRQGRVPKFQLSRHLSRVWFDRDSVALELRLGHRLDQIDALLTELAKSGHD